jgi:carbonic anhydrase/acetyltransferase-like protein (isoleucine patch superfamily)
MRIGEGSVISFSARLDKTNPRGIHIGKNTVVTLGVTILTHDHVENRYSEVYIGDDCFTGAHSIILPGVRIGDHCIVAAGSVVFNDLPAHSMAAGNPARVVEINVNTEHYGIRYRERMGARVSRVEVYRPKPSRSTRSVRSTIISEIQGLAEAEGKNPAAAKGRLDLIGVGLRLPHDCDPRSPARRSSRFGTRHDLADP